MKKRLLLTTLGLASAAIAAAAGQLTYVDLVKRLTDLERLAGLPDAGERCAQWSSYDRASQYDEAAAKYLKWDANGDGGGYIRKEGDRFVFAEMEGPGCIWRIWSARPEKGRVWIYLDGADEPAVDLPFLGYFDRKNEPFTRAALVHTVAMGWNNYTPIPYQKSCKIVAEKGWGAYYQFVYTTYPKGTQVPTFRRQLSAEENAALDEANKMLTSVGSEPGADRPEARTFRGELEVPAGGEVSQRLEGPAAIASVRVKLAGLPGSPEDRTVLRELTVEARWDDEAAPSVWSPCGDFFGTAAGANKYRSLPSGLTEDGWWYCHWFMPFARSADITLRNDGSQARSLEFELVTVPLAGDLSRYGRFHAKWHRDALLPEDPDRRKIDWTMLKTEGRGRFLGVMLHVWNPRGSWWGEGDEKFFVDGEKFPSTIGTGSEDYFGYAWCNPALFENAYHNQTISMGNKGHVCVNRWHVTDNIPFQTSFEAAIEKYFPNSRPTLYASTVYWYLAPGGQDPYPALPLSERAGYWYDLTNFVAKGALEGERLKVLARTGGNPHEQDLSNHAGDWSHGAHLWWTGAKPGDKLDLALPVQDAGRYKLIVAMTKAVDYGIAQLYLDDRKLGDPIDFYNRGVVPTGPIALGEHDLAAGQHKLTIEITGANPRAVKSYMTGLDYVRLEPVK
jgi:hypothetical protein